MRLLSKLGRAVASVMTTLAYVLGLAVCIAAVQVLIVLFAQSIR